MSDLGSGPSEQGDDGQPQFIVPAPKTSFVTKLRNYFLTGIVITAPISLTVYLTWLFIDWVDRQVTPLLPAKYNPETYLPFGIPGLGLVIMVVFLIFVGFITANLFGRTLINLGERLVNRMPVVRTVYNAFKQILETVLQSSSQSFRQVVMLEYPRRGVWALAFVTADAMGEIARKADDELVNIFLPTTPNPTSGFLLMVPKRDLIYLDMSVEEAAKFIISAGVIMPKESVVAGAEVIEGSVIDGEGNGEGNGGRRNRLMTEDEA
jgi:uncharacterized membrane protein